MQSPHGSTVGLKPAQIDPLRRLRRRRVRPTQVNSPELATTLCEISADTRRQVGVLLDRKGHVASVVIGDADRIHLPDVGRHRAGRARLRGLRLVHTHLRDEPISQEDLTDLSRLHLDMVVAVCAGPDGRPRSAHSAQVLPDNPAGDLWSITPPQTVHELARVDFLATIRALETELARMASLRDAEEGERAVLVQVRTGPVTEAEASLAELRELCRTAGVIAADVLVQRRARLDPRYVVGRGKVEEIVLRALQLDAEAILFDHDLSPGQTKALGNVSELKVVDRTQLILDIFAQHAQSRGGKLQVELAQLRYLLPRLAGRYTQLSRQGGGLAARGPGEKKLEMDRRRMRQRIHRLERELTKLGRQREQRRVRRKRAGVPVVAIVGYTNAGKSTLLNALTRSDVRVEDRLFATLDPTTRRLRFPRDRQLVLADTVGFIRNLPRDLVEAFKATLEELADANLLIHVVDAADDDMDARIEAVTGILAELSLGHIPRLLAVNKADLLPRGEAEEVAEALGGVALSALDRRSARPLLERLERTLWQEGIEVVTPGEGSGATSRRAR